MERIEIAKQIFFYFILYLILYYLIVYLIKAMYNVVGMEYG